MHVTQKDLEKILLSIKIGNPEFWEFLKGKIKSYPVQVHDFGWSCFPILDDDEKLVDIRVLVPKIVDEGTLLVNIHELTHAYRFYNMLGQKYNIDVDFEEEYARGKEKEYLELKNRK